MSTPSKREHWSGSIGFILAAAGSAVGLGNIWKFPYITGENGGGAFVLVYLICIAVIGIPVMICEVTIGRHTQRNPIGAFMQLTPPPRAFSHLIGLCMCFAGLAFLFFQCWGWGILCLIIGLLIFKFSWKLVGVMGFLAGFTILSFYSVVAGWTLGYVIKGFSGSLTTTSVADAEATFGAFITTPWLAIGCHAGFMFLCVTIIYKGVRNGIERWSKILMPTLFVLIIVLIMRGLTLPGAMAGVRFYLSPDFSKIDANSILIALGHAFFSLSLGMGAIITYGSYMHRKQNILTSSLSIVALDTLVALLAGLAIFPAVFAQGFEPNQGPGLVFQVLPTVFNQIPLGGLWATLFFLLLLVAALTSGISLLEVVTAHYVDDRGWSRKKAAIVMGTIIFLLGSLCAVSVADWKHIEFLQHAIAKVFGKTPGSFFDLMDQLSSNYLLPLGGLFISLFVGWIWGTRHAVEEIRQGSHNFADVHLISLMAGLKDDPSHNSQIHVLTLASLWGIFIRFISPVAVLIAFLNTIGVIQISRNETNLHEKNQAMPPVEKTIEQPASGELPE